MKSVKDEQGKGPSTTDGNDVVLADSSIVALPLTSAVTILTAWTSGLVGEGWVFNTGLVLAGVVAGSLIGPDTSTKVVSAVAGILLPAVAFAACMLIGLDPRVLALVLISLAVAVQTKHIRVHKRMAFGISTLAGVVVMILLPRLLNALGVVVLGWRSQSAWLFGPLFAVLVYAGAVLSAVLCKNGRCMFGQPASGRGYDRAG